MQNIYYSGSGASSSLTLIEENGSVSSWVGNTLIVCSSLQEIIITSGSNNIAIFPTENTNIFYGIDYKANTTPQSFSFSNSYLTLNIFYSLIDIDGDLLITDTPGYYVSSSINNYYKSLSGSNAFTQPSSAGSTSASGSNTLVLSPGVYEIGVFLNSPSWSYSSSISIYNTTDPFNSIINTSGSVYQPVTASLFLSASYTYNTYLFISGGYI
jgi:hypothetical protein